VKCPITITCEAFARRETGASYRRLGAPLTDTASRTEDEDVGGHGPAHDESIDCRIEVELLLLGAEQPSEARA